MDLACSPTHKPNLKNSERSESWLRVLRSSAGPFDFLGISNLHVNEVEEKPGLEKNGCLLWMLKLSPLIDNGSTHIKDEVSERKRLAKTTNGPLFIVFICCAKVCTISHGPVTALPVAS